MPVIFRQDGFRFFFYSNEGSPLEPVHVHVRKGEGDGFDARTLRQLEKIVQDRATFIERAWHEHFG